jgi:DNA-binding NarL/FixJ family response regulator
MKYLIVDDHPLILHALAEEFSENAQCVLAKSLQESLRLVEEHSNIDLIILDLGLPDSEGVQGLMDLRSAAPSIPVLVLSGNTDRDEIQKVLEFGASGYITKNTAISVLKQAIQLVLAGGTYVPSEFIANKNIKPRRHVRPDDDDAGLTPREKEILSLLALGLSNKSIATQLDLSENTVRIHVTHILKKMGVDNRAQVVSKLLFGGK